MMNQSIIPQFHLKVTPSSHVYAPLQHLYLCQFRSEPKTTNLHALLWIQHQSYNQARILGKTPSNPTYDCMIGFGTSALDIAGLIRRGQYGMEGFCNWSEACIEQLDIQPSLLEGC